MGLRVAHVPGHMPRLKASSCSTEFHRSVGGSGCLADAHGQGKRCRAETMEAMTLAALISKLMVLPGHIVSASVEGQRELFEDRSSPSR